MPSKQRQLSIPQTPVSAVPATIFYRLPQSQKPQLAHLIADLIRRVRTAAQDKEGNHERLSLLPLMPTTDQRAKMAYVYIRQSSLMQVTRHAESTDLQYSLGKPSSGVGVATRTRGTH